MPRDLKEPEGWRFSSLRKMRLEGGFALAWWEEVVEWELCVPFCGFGERGGLDQRG